MAQLTAAGVVPVSKKLAVDLMAVGYTHDRVEGLALGPGNMLFISNDDDFGIFSPVVGTMSQKILPATGQVDKVQLLQLK